MSAPGPWASPRDAVARREEFVRFGIPPEFYAEHRLEAQRLRARTIGVLFSQLMWSLREAWWRGRKRVASQPLP